MEKNYLLTTKSILMAPFIPNAPIKLMVHGYLSSRDGWPLERLMPGK